MTDFTNIPKHVEDLLATVTTSRRGLFKSAGLFVVSIATAKAQAPAPAAEAPPAPQPA